MKFVSCLLSCFLFSTSTLIAEDSLKGIWKEWKAKYNRNYDTKIEELYRFGVWTSNYYKIKEHNALNNRYTLGLNKFGDMTEAEFKDFVNPNGGCLKIHEVDSSLFIQPKISSFQEIPSSVDWANSSLYVTPVKDQGSCGSCWAFSATGSTESQYAIATGELNSLSEQELVDCSDAYGNAGCDGGYMDSAFLYIKNNNGLSLESEYPYTGTDGTCEKEKYTHYNPITGFQLVARDNETELEIAVANGPVSVGIQADQFAFQFYTGGILDGHCGTDIDHGVLVVGYGADGDGKYWIVKNSWGTDWGEDGYVRICRSCDKNDDKGECCINCQPSYPLISSSLIKDSVQQN